MIEWERRFMYNTMGSEERKGSMRWEEIVKLKEKASKLRKNTTWTTLRVANIPTGASRKCNICKVSGINMTHFLTHSPDFNQPNGLPSRLMNILSSDE